MKSAEVQHKLPRGRTGLAILWIVQHLQENPGASIRDVLKEVSKICLISQSSHRLVAANGKLSGKLWERRKRADGLIGLWLLPAAQELTDTFEAKQLEIKQFWLDKLSKRGVSLGDITEVVAFNKHIVANRVLSEMSIVFALVLDVNLDGTVRILYQKHIFNVPMERVQIKRVLV